MFENPDVYDITRRAKRHLGFGGGVHACLGSMIGRLATQIAYEELLARIPEFARTQAVLDWVPSSNFRSPKALALWRG
jgi:cytochrome P450